jgi:hypothetical protein
MMTRNPDVRIDPVLEAVVRKLLEKAPDNRPASGNAARELFELYERDRAGCALLLGVELPASARRTGAIEELDDAEVADEPEAPPPVRAHSPSQNQHGSRDPELDRETDELQTGFPRARIAVVALAVVGLLALLLGLGLRRDDKSKAPAVAVEADAGIELLVVETMPEELHVVVPVPVEERTEDRSDAPLEQTIAAPKVGPKKPVASPTPQPPAVAAPTAAEVARLYGVTGRELKALDDEKGMDATIELWPRYRWIRINEWIATPERRTQIAQELERLRVDIKASY